MSSSEIAQGFIQALENKDHAGAASFLTDDYVFSGVAPQPINKAAFLGMEQAVHQAFPDWQYNQIILEDTGDVVKATVQNTGTHNGVMDLSGMGLPIPPIQPTGTKLDMPVEPIEYHIRDGKIYEMTAAPIPGGGVPGMLQQIGVVMPAPAH